MTGILRNYVLPALLMIGILVAWDFTKPRFPAHFAELTPEQTSDQPNGGVPPWNANEKILQNSRDLNRKSTLRGLDQAWSTFCTREGRKNLGDTLTAYFGRRQQEESSYQKRWGDAGRDYIAKQWTTADDLRIERLVQETYERGYLDLHDLKPYIADRMSPLLKDTRVTAQPCKT
jgi:hypothetical protein